MIVPSNKTHFPSLIFDPPRKQLTSLSKRGINFLKSSRIIQPHCNYRKETILDLNRSAPNTVLCDGIDGEHNIPPGSSQGFTFCDDVVQLVERRLAIERLLVQCSIRAFLALCPWEKHFTLISCWAKQSTRRGGPGQLKTCKQNLLKGVSWQDAWCHKNKQHGLTCRKGGVWGILDLWHDINFFN